MNPAVYVLIPLGVSSLVLAVIFAIAWSRFGQQRHALTWAVGYAVAGTGWLIDLANDIFWPDVLALRPVVLALALFYYATLTLGFRQRANLPTRKWPLFAITGLAALLTTAQVFGMLPVRGFGNALMPLACGTLLALSAKTLVGRGEETNAAEGAAFVMLSLFATLNLGVALGWLLQGANPGPEWRTASNLLTTIGTPTAFTTLGFFAVFLLAADLAEKMRRLAILDPLTSILNRRGFEQAASIAIANSRRAGCDLTLVLADLDRFKQINDTYGHAAGDAALQRFVSHVESLIRKGDCFGRVGGEEFALILVNSSAAEAMEVTERIRQGLEKLEIVDDVRLTASFGVSGLAQVDSAVGDLMIRADAALYRSKMNGRNRVTLGDDPPRRSPTAGSTALRAAQVPPAQHR